MTDGLFVEEVVWFFLKYFLQSIGLVCMLSKFSRENFKFSKNIDPLAISSYFKSSYLWQLLWAGSLFIASCFVRY